jgi:hypothetical protein
MMPMPFAFNDENQFVAPRKDLKTPSTNRTILADRSNLHSTPFGSSLKNNKQALAQPLPSASKTKQKVKKKTGTLFFNIEPMVTD